MIHRISVASVAIGLSASIVAFLIMNGFKQTVENKIYSFSAHLLVNSITSNNSMEEVPFDFNINLYQYPDSFPEVDHVQEYSHKGGLIKHNQDILGVMLKGVGKSFDQNRFASNMVDGEFIHFKDSGYSNEIVISRAIANKLDAKTGDQINIHFFQNPPRARKLKIAGIYETNLSDYFDEKIIVCDIGLIQRLNGWEPNQAGGLQVFLKDPTQTQQAYENITDRIPFELYVEKTSDRYIQVFEWLHLITRQVRILLVIILLVICVNMISVILILVMERTTMIGMLKALGSGNGLIRNIFLFQGVQLVLKGLGLGNLIGLGLCYIQYQFRLIKLDPENYYMDFVPIAWEWGTVLWLNLIILLVVSVVLILPVAIISRIRPLAAIRFD